MRKAIACGVVGVLLVTLGCSSAESVVKPGYDFGQVEAVAVTTVAGQLKSEAARNQVADFFNMELLRYGYEPVERSQVNAVLEELDFQASEISSPENVARAGEIMNVDAIVIVNIPVYGQEVNMTAKMLDVEDGSVLWVASGSGSTGRTLGTVAGALIGGGLGVAAGGDSTGRVVGGAAGAVAGGVVGRALSPQEANQVHKVVKKVCRELPARGSAL
ncbi:MAG: CsgG/HfaB family protein [Candidatus Brocadiia bacterium]